MKDFITKLKTFESLFLYNYATYDKNTNKLKIYLISPDQEHQYISIDMSRDENNAYQCEVGSLYFLNEEEFEDTPISTFTVSLKNKTDFQAYHKRKRLWDSRDIKHIINSFSSKDLII